MLKCPQCEMDNPVGAIYCVGCGARLTVTDTQARANAVAAARHEAWQKAFFFMNRALFLFVFLFIVALLFRGCARREILADFGAAAPLPAPPPFTRPITFARLPELPFPPVDIAKPIPPDKAAEAAVLQSLCQARKSQVTCKIWRKRGGPMPATLVYRTDKEIHYILEDGWGPPLKVGKIEVKDVDLGRSEFP